MQRIAIVTGASSGVGAEFVRQFDAGKGGPLDAIWLVSRNKAILEEVAASCKRIHALPIPCDLTSPEAFSQLQQLFTTHDVVVEWLVNSAGFGKFGDYREVGISANTSMVQLNCLAVVQMTSIALEHMHKGSRIINLSSIAGAIPQSMLATYSATKAFVLELSQMLNHELGPSGIHVTAVCPKFMHTKFLDSPGSSTAAEGMCRIGFEEVESVVAKALRSSLTGRSLCVPSPDMKFARIVAHLIPRTLLFKVEDTLFR